MANEIHNYPIETYSLNDNDWLDVDMWNGMGYDSAKLQGFNFKNTIFSSLGRGSYYSVNNQIPTAANTPNSMEFSTIDFQSGVQLIASDTIEVLKNGVFNVQFSAQLSRTSGGSTQQISIWFRKNGFDIPNSNTHLNVQANAGKLVAAWNYFFNLNQNDTIQIMYSVTSTTIQLLHENADLAVPHPATPSVIVTINQVA
jgi:hypothetical protein